LQFSEGERRSCWGLFAFSGRTTKINISRSPWWCDTCHDHIPTNTLTHADAATGLHHSVRGTPPTTKNATVTIDSFTRTGWTEVETRHPGGLQWMGPGTYVVAVNNDTNDQLAEVRITLANSIDGADVSDMLAWSVAGLLRSFYGGIDRHTEAGERLLTYVWHDATTAKISPVITVRVLIEEEQDPQRICAELERALRSTIAALSTQ
jgi:hypothetical protein